MPKTSSIEKYLKDGKVFFWPSKKEARDVVFAYLSKEFEKDKKYSERQVNEILGHYIAVLDVAFFRRALYDNGYLDRTNDGREYWRK
jgi:hypothetical protein